MNWHDSGRFCTESLESAAKRYKTLGFSIIPLQGARNPQQPKLSAIRWARYQHTIATDEELDNWFGAEPDAGIGIVCGRVSRLMVLDFDDASQASEFRHLFPDLVQTLVVRSGTRGLPHFYFRLPAGKLISTAAYQGVDVRAEGSYVVAPPTRVGNAAWVVDCDAPIRKITAFDLRRIVGFLTSRKTVSGTSHTEAESMALKADASEFRHIMTSEELVQHYRDRCCKGRNQALFQTAVIARDMGITETAFVVLLAGIHATEPGAAHESYSVRYGEAIRTIASAYSRPSRQKQEASTGLSNAIREWLLGHRLACLARVIDGLYFTGMRAGALFTEADACRQLTRLKIGRRSIMAALKSVVDGFAVFAATVTPLNPPQDANAANVAKSLTHSCEMSRGAKRVRNGMKGRPAKLYRLPSSSELAAKFGVSAKSGDSLSDADFGNPKLYREALHEKLLTRRPGQYARTWLAARLGVSRWTARRYEKARGIVVQATFTEEKLNWNSARRLPSTRTSLARGVFIETRDGKRYPAVRGLALKLLKTDQQAVLRYQHGNYYAAQRLSVGIPTPQPVFVRHEDQRLRFGTNAKDERELAISVGIPTLQGFSAEQITHIKAADATKDLHAAAHADRGLCVGIPTPQAAEATFWYCSDCLNFHVMNKLPEGCIRCGGSSWQTLPAAIWRDADALRVWWQERYREYQAAKRPQLYTPVSPESARVNQCDQVLADRLHLQVPELSLKNARHLVSRFSGQLIEKALEVIKGRGGLRNPAGFLITFLKSESKLSAGQEAATSEKPKAESAMDWLRRLAKSEYLNFISNADDILNSNGTGDLVLVGG